MLTLWEDRPGDRREYREKASDNPDSISSVVLNSDSVSLYNFFIAELEKNLFRPVLLYKESCGLFCIKFNIS